MLNFSTEYILSIIQTISSDEIKYEINWSLTFKVNIFFNVTNYCQLFPKHFKS